MIDIFKCGAADLAYRSVGEGAPIVLVHGMGEDLRSWDHVADSLQASFRTIAYSRRYHAPNQTRGDGSDYTYRVHADDLVALLNHVGTSAHLVGHSYGAMISLMVGLECPGLVNSLTLIEPPGNSLIEGDPEYPLIASRRKQATDNMLAAIDSGKPEDATRLLIEWVNNSPGIFSTLPTEEQDIALANAITLGYWLKGPTLPRISCSELSTLKPRLLVISGSETNPYYALVAAAITSCVPGAQHSRIPGASHMVASQQPWVVATIVTEFLRSF